MRTAEVEESLVVDNPDRDILTVEQMVVDSPSSTASSSTRALSLTQSFPSADVAPVNQEAAFANALPPELASYPRVYPVALPLLADTPDPSALDVLLEVFATVIRRSRQAPPNAIFIHAASEFPSINMAWIAFAMSLASSLSADDREQPALPEEMTTPDAPATDDTIVLFDDMSVLTL